MRFAHEKGVRWRLVPSGRPAPSAAHQIDIRSRLEERIGRGFDAIHSRDRIEDDVLLLDSVVRNDLLQTDLAERELRTLLGPANCGIVNGVAVLGQLYDYAKPDGYPCDLLVISSKRKFGLRAAASASPRYSLPATGCTR